MKSKSVYDKIQRYFLFVHLINRSCVYWSLVAQRTMVCERADGSNANDICLCFVSTIQPYILFKFERLIRNSGRTLMFEFRSIVDKNIRDGARTLYKYTTLVVNQQWTHFQLKRLCTIFEVAIIIWRIYNVDNVWMLMDF